MRAVVDEEDMEILVRLRQDCWYTSKSFLPTIKVQNYEKYTAAIIFIHIPHSIRVANERRKSVYLFYSESRTVISEI